MVSEVVITKFMIVDYCYIFNIKLNLCTLFQGSVTENYEVQIIYYTISGVIRRLTLVNSSWKHCCVDRVVFRLQCNCEYIINWYDSINLNVLDRFKISVHASLIENIFYLLCQFSEISLTLIFFVHFLYDSSSISSG